MGRPTKCYNGNMCNLCRSSRSKVFFMTDEFMKKRLRHRYFQMDFFRDTFFKNTFGGSFCSCFTYPKYENALKA